MRKSVAKGYWKISTAVGLDDDGAEALKHSDYLNGKVGALLAHVSLMAVTTTWFLTYTKPVELSSQKIAVASITNISLAAELFVYIIITMLCLRAIWVTRPSTFYDIIKNNKTVFSETEQKHAVDIFLHEVTLRKSCFIIALRLTVLTSVAFILSFVAKFGIYIT